MQDFVLIRGIELSNTPWDIFSSGRLYMLSSSCMKTVKIIFMRLMLGGFILGSLRLSERVARLKCSLFMLALGCWPLKMLALGAGSLKMLALGAGSLKMLALGAGSLFMLALGTGSLFMLAFVLVCGFVQLCTARKQSSRADGWRRI